MSITLHYLEGRADVKFVQSREPFYQISFQPLQRSFSDIECFTRERHSRLWWHQVRGELKFPIFHICSPTPFVLALVVNEMIDNRLPWYEAQRLFWSCHLPIIHTFYQQNYYINSRKRGGEKRFRTRRTCSVGYSGMRFAYNSKSGEERNWKQFVGLCRRNSGARKTIPLKTINESRKGLFDDMVKCWRNMARETKPYLAKENKVKITEEWCFKNQFSIVWEKLSSGGWMPIEQIKNMDNGGKESLKSGNRIHFSEDN